MIEPTHIFIVAIYSDLIDHKDHLRIYAIMMNFIRPNAIV